MSQARVSVREERESHSMQMDRRQKRRGNHQWSVVRGIWRPRVSEAERRVREGVEKLKTVKETRLIWYIYCRECLSCTEFFVGLGASGETETEKWCGEFYGLSVWIEQHSSVRDEGYMTMEHLTRDITVFWARSGNNRLSQVLVKLFDELLPNVCVFVSLFIYFFHLRIN